MAGSVRVVAGLVTAIVPDGPALVYPTELTSSGVRKWRKVQVEERGLNDRNSPKAYTHTQGKCG